MGNEMSQMGQVPATIGVHLDQSAVFSGQQLTGRVYLKVHRNDVDCSGLDITISGNEHTDISWRDSVVESRPNPHAGEKHGHGKHKTVEPDAISEVHTEVRTSTQSVQFLSMSYQLAQMPAGRIDVGNYEFPFSFVIPNGVPGSLLVEKKSALKSHACTSYQVDVNLRRYSSMSYAVAATCPFMVITSQPAVQPMPIYMEPNIRHVYTCCCFDRGTVACGAYCSANVLAPGEHAVVHYAVHNLSETKLAAVLVRVNQYCKWTAMDKSDCETTVLYEQTVPIDDEDLQVAEPFGGGNEGRKRLQIIQKMLESGQFAVDLFLDPTAIDSFQGKLMSVTHELEVTFVTSFFTSNVSLTRPFTVVRNTQQRPSALPLPQTGPPAGLPTDWSAKAAATVSLPAIRYAEPVEVQRGAGGLIQCPNGYAPSAPPMEALRSEGMQPVPPYGSDPFDSLIQSISVSFDQCGELQKWLSAHLADSIRPLQVCSLFQAVRTPMEQVAFAQTLSRAMSGVACEQLAEAARGSLTACKRDVVEGLIGRHVIRDKANRHLVMSQLSPYEYVTVEKYFY